MSTTPTPATKVEVKPPVAKPVTAAAASKVVLKTERLSELPFWSTYRLGIAGAPESGKTRLFATLSRAWKEDEDGHPVATGLEDIYYCETDEGGGNSIREWGIDCPILDMGKMTDGEIYSALSELPGFLANEAAKIKARGVCIDTGSRLVKAVLNTLIKRGLDKAPLYNTLAMELRKFLFAMRAVHCPLVWNFHIKPPAIIEGADDQGVRIAAGLGASDLEIDIDGRASKALIRDSCTHIYHLETREMPGNKTVRQLSADSRVESKRRMQKLTSAVEPAHLGKLFEKLAASMNIPLP